MTLPTMEAAPDYPELLRAAITDAGVSRRRLSFLLAERTGNKQDSEYRALGKYLAGEELPSRMRAAILAVLLQTPELALVPATTQRRQDHLEAIGETLQDLRVGQEEGIRQLLDEIAAMRETLALPGGGVRVPPKQNRS